MHRVERWPVFFSLVILLIAAGVLRSAWATRLDGFTIDEPWHITAGAAYLRTGEFYLNPEHPPLVKIVAGLAAPRSVFQFANPGTLRDKRDERKFVEETMYARNDADLVQSRVCHVMYLFNGLLLLFFAVSTFRTFGGVVALGALLFALIDPTVAAHWPVAMTDLPVALLSVASVLLCVETLRNWTKVNLCLLAITLGLTLSVKHSGLIAYGFVGMIGLIFLACQFRHDKRVALRRTGTFLLVLVGAVGILWGMYRFRYAESSQRNERFNRPLALKIEDIRSPLWRSSLTGLARYHLLPRSYIWGLADTVRTGIEGRANSEYAFGRLTFMQPRPFLFPGYIAVKLPIPLLLLAAFGCVITFGKSKATKDKVATAVLLTQAAVMLIVLARSADAGAGIRHALTVYFVLAIFAGFAVQHLVRLQRRSLGFAALGLAVASCVPALTVERPWEYHNIGAGGTGGAYRYFRNEGMDLGQRDKEIADYCHRRLEPVGEVPYLIYFGMSKSDRDYRHVQVKSLRDPADNDLPPVSVSGTLLVSASFGVTPAVWSDNKALREARPVDRFGDILVYRGTYYLPNARADALFSRAEDLLEGSKPDFANVNRILKEALVLRPSDFRGWMLLGNTYLLGGNREQALAAYQEARDTTPPSPFRALFDEQIRLVSTRALDSVQPMRDPGIE